MHKHTLCLHSCKHMYTHSHSTSRVKLKVPHIYSFHKLCFLPHSTHIISSSQTHTWIFSDTHTAITHSAVLHSGWLAIFFRLQTTGGKPNNQQFPTRYQSKLSSRSSIDFPVTVQETGFYIFAFSDNLETQ